MYQKSGNTGNTTQIIVKSRLSRLQNVTTRSGNILSEEIKEESMDTKILKSRLEKLNKCKGLSEDDLRGKYKKAYEALQAEIYQISNGIIKYISLYGLKFQDEAVSDELNAVIESKIGKTIMKKCKISLMEECSYDNFISHCYEMRDEFKKVAIKHADPSWDSYEFDVPHLEE